MHEGLDPEQFRLLKSQRITTADIGSIEWWNLTRAQFDERTLKFNATAKRKALLMWELGPNWDKAVTKNDFEQMGESPFEENKEEVAEFSPAYWFAYFWNEVRKEKLTADQSQLGLEAIQLLFEKEATTKLSRGFKLTLKQELIPAKGPGVDGAAPRFTISGNGSDIWRTALTNLLKIGFLAVKSTIGSGPVGDSLKQCLLEKGLHDKITGEVGKLRIFWRADSRSVQAFSQGAKRTVDDAQAAAKFALDQDWHPYSDPEIKRFLWFRKGSADNDFYTVVSVTTDVKTAATFPLVDERRAYQMPLKAPSDWTVGERRQYAGNLAIGEVGGKSEVLIVTKTNVFMLVLNGGVVLKTEEAGGQYRGDAGSSFPESGVKGYPVDSFIAEIPIIRIHHGPTNGAGFTAYLDRTKQPKLLVQTEDLMHRYGEQGAREVLMAFQSKGMDVLNGLSTAWSSTGATTPGTALRIAKYQYPVKPEDVEMALS